MTDYHPPTGPEIAEHLEAGGRVERWDAVDQRWGSTNIADPNCWRDCAAEQPGYRLVPLPPKTERVMAWEAVRDGRRVPNGPDYQLSALLRIDSTFYAQSELGNRYPVADDGSIEVLVEGPE